jgi:preprotein translocase subunit YajC
MFNILLQAQKGMDWGSFIFFPLIIIVFYFFMIRQP